MRRLGEATRKEMAKETEQRLISSEQTSKHLHGLLGSAVTASVISQLCETQLCETQASEKIRLGPNYRRL